jgi:thiamine biosynthesis protein ThiC
MRKEAGASDEEVCSMCGEFCSVKIGKEMKDNEK